MPESARGRSTRNWRRIVAAQKAKRLPCFHCGQPIRYDKLYPHPDSFTADHLKPRLKYPELAEDPGNVVSSHARCNWTKGDREQFAPSLGALSEEF